MHWANCRRRSICWDNREPVSREPARFFNMSLGKPCTIEVSGRGAAWLARLLGVQEVPSSNLGGPTKNSFYCNVSSFPPDTNFGTIVAKL
jgi:hypothetical protein